MSFLRPFSRSELLVRIPHFAAFKYRDYRSTWTANMLSGGAMWTFVVASSWLVLEMSDSSAWVGLVTFGSMIPFLVVSPVGGFLADRFNRRNLALVTFVGSAATGTALVLLALFGTVALWHIVLLAFVAGVFRAVQEPTIQALIPNQVPREHLLNAIALNSMTRHGARLFGPLVAAVLLGLGIIDIKGVLILSALFYALGAVQMARIHTVSTGVTRQEYSLARNMIDGLVYIYTHRGIALFIILVAFHCVLVMSFESILPVLTREELGATDLSTLNNLVMAFGAGSLVGTFLMAGVRSEALKGQLLIWTGLASGVTPIMLALSGNVPLTLAASAGMGVSQATFMALTNTYVQSVAPDALRGRIASLYTLHAGGLMAFSNLGYGLLADVDVISAPHILLVTAVIYIAAVLLLSAGQPVLRQVYRTGEVAVT